ncbi:MAG: FtsQ-type POTRA domain-containing protein [Treponema sp.]|nr:FtsQ-type POTRA domain-containing protein [Treponema sp.]MBQ7881260.1 FtsQ-type POTRA domain-containing protein [Treponema sp.]
MSDFALNFYDQFEDSDVKKESKKSKNFALKLLLGILVSLLFIEILIYLFVLPCMGTVKIKWSGLNNYSREEVEKSISSYLNLNFFKFKTYEVNKILSNFPGVESVNIVRKFPDKIYINVKERVPVAMIFSEVGGKTVPIQIDKNGVLFPSKSLSFLDNGEIPIVSGIPVENIPQGMRLPSKYLTLIDQISSISAINKNYFAEVSEIHVVPKEYGNYELVLYPVRGHIKVLADRTLNEEALQYMMVTLDVVKGLDPSVEVVDLRYGSVSYHSNMSDVGVSFE